MSFTIKVDTGLLDDLAEDLASTTGNIAEGMARGVNAAAKVIRKESVAKVISQVNLKEPYVNPRVTLDQEAKPELPTAVIGAPMRGTLLDRFDSHQQVYANVWTAAKYAAKFGSIAAPAPLPTKNGKRRMLPWIPRKGDSLRGIPVGKKQAGITATIKAGGDKDHFKHVFLIPARRAGQDGSKFVTLSRPKGGGAPKAKYGPSVDQVVKGVWRDGEKQIAETLGDSVLAEVSSELIKGLVK